MPLILGTNDRAVEPARIRLTAAGAAMVTVGAGLGLRAVAAGSLAKYGGDKSVSDAVRPPAPDVPTVG